MSLQEEKAKLVDVYARILEQIDKYWNISSPKTDELLKKKETIQNKIEEINKLLNIK